jgi:hypothetical protein
VHVEFKTVNAGAEIITCRAIGVDADTMGFRTETGAEKALSPMAEADESAPPEGVGIAHKPGMGFIAFGRETAGIGEEDLFARFWRSQTLSGGEIDSHEGASWRLKFFV